jgi:mRNA-degrading endonuclease toxin of MazEF toxin-antitoxin module
MPWMSKDSRESMRRVVIVSPFVVCRRGTIATCVPVYLDPVHLEI